MPAHDRVTQRQPRIISSGPKTPVVSPDSADIQAASSPSVFQSSDILQLQRNIGNRAVQRMMPLTDYQNQTPGKYRSRSGVHAIDKLVRDYEAMGSDGNGMIARDAKLAAIITACQNYGGNRAVGVTALLASAQTEQTFIRPLSEGVTFTGAGNFKQALKKLFAGQDAFLVAMRGGHAITDRQKPDFNVMFTPAQIAMSQAGNRAQIMQELILEDLATIRAMAADANVDQLLRDILNEILANADDTYFQETGGVASGAVLAGPKDRAKGINEKYRLDMQLVQKEGSPERISSLVHEMTHIAVQETFGNTPIHLAFRSSRTDPEVLALSAGRTTQLQELKQDLEATRAVWSAGQYGVLEEKVEYPISGKNTLTSYANTFKKKGELTDPEYDRIIDLAAQGANNTLIEFDTVINQMLFLMTAWNIPADNAFHMRLQAVAQEAYDWRHS